MTRKKTERTKEAARQNRSENQVRYDVNLLTEDDIYLFNEGSHFRLYEKLGSQPMHKDGRDGTLFAVWAPDAERVSVIGDFNGWNKSSHLLREKGVSGIWEGFIPGVGKGATYKYSILSRYNGYEVEKADPFAFYTEQPPRTASIVWDLEYAWGDGEWMKKERSDHNRSGAAISIYEVHPGSWMRVPEEDNRSLSYRELAERLVEHTKQMNFTHVEFLPVMEHPFYGSWGYQTLGYFAPTSRYGEPQDFMHLVDCFHRNGIGVILDWVPSHFPDDEYGLGFFDGTYLYEHSDLKKRIHPDWESLIFNYGRNEIRSFLISSALFWLQVYHADGLRVDAVASMLYLDYSRKEGEWIPNEFGGRENLEAISFLRRLNEVAYENPDIQTIAEESTDWPMVSRPTYLGGLGFGMKWDMGWMHDTLSYMSRDPIYRKHHHDTLTFRMLYAFHENFVLPLSHDEVVHGKGSLLSKMPGDDWQKFANLRLLYGYMYAQPGKKLLFMGGEFGQWSEWHHDESLEWHLLQYDPHSGLKKWLQDLNDLYVKNPALYERDFEPEGFEWIDCGDSQQSVISLVRKGLSEKDRMLVICNFTPVTHFDYKVGAPRKGIWKEALNSDSAYYGGSGQGNLGGIHAGQGPCHGRPYRLKLTLPPLATVYLKWEEGDGR